MQLTFVYKQFQSFDKTYNQIVAEYTARPDKAETFYENTRKLLMYYNATTLYENNLTGLKVYFEQMDSLKWLKKQPSIIKTINPNSDVQRGYGIHMTTNIKSQGEIWLRDWLLESRGQNNLGEEILNLHTIYSIPLLQELIKYNQEDNFDRVIAFLLVMIHSKDNHQIKVQQETLTKYNFLDKQFFKKNVYRNN